MDPSAAPGCWLPTALFNLLGMPATQVPLGLGRKGLPVGRAGRGRPGQNDHVTIAVAMELERSLGGWVPAGLPVAESFDVVIVGARCAGRAARDDARACRPAACLVDKDRFPSDTLSTHVIQRLGFQVSSGSASSNRCSRCHHRCFAAGLSPTTSSPWSTTSPPLRCAGDQRPPGRPGRDPRPSRRGGGRGR